MDFQIEEKELISKSIVFLSFALVSLIQIQNPKGLLKQPSSFIDIDTCSSFVFLMFHN